LTIASAYLRDEGAMIDGADPFAAFELVKAIQLRWNLRDIAANRLKLSPIADGDLRLLIEPGLVEMQDDGSALTPAGTAALD
jgi:hypothetical protein